jgi:peptidyl-prolyl cis-trans isomerase C
MRLLSLVSLVLIAAFTMQALAEDGHTSADAAGRARVFATVGSEAITVGELEDKINARSPYARARFAEPEVLREFADSQVKNELFYQGAEKLGYAKDPEVSRFVDQTIVQMFVRNDFEGTGKPDDVSVEDVEEYYQEHPEEFRRAEMRRARHILVASKDEAKDIRAQLLGSDTSVSFRALAKERSLDTETKLRGGDLLYFTEDGKPVGKESGAVINTTLAKATFKLERTGDMSEPVDLGDGKWSVLEITAIRPERVQKLEQASAAIRQTLWRHERESALQKRLTELREELKPEVYPERMDAIVLEHSNGPIEPPHQ